MIKISAGPSLVEYGACFGIPTDEVVEWVNQYVNGPWPESMKAHNETTEKERLSSIKAYISKELAGTLTAQIRNELAAEKLEAA